MSQRYLLTPSGHRQIRDVITTGIDTCKTYMIRCFYHQAVTILSLFIRPLEHLIKKSPVPTKRAPIILNEINSSNSLRMLLVCTSIYLKSVLRYKFLIFDTYHPDTLHMREQGCEKSWLFFEAQRGPRAKLQKTMGYALQKYGPQVSQFQLPINSSNRNFIFVCFPVRFTLSVCLIHFAFIALRMPGGKHQIINFPLCNSLDFPIIYFPQSPTLLDTLFSSIPTPDSYRSYFQLDCIAGV